LASVFKQGEFGRGKVKQKNKLIQAVYSRQLLNPYLRDEGRSIRLGKLKRSNEFLMSEVLGEILSEIKNHPGLKREASYLDEIEELMKQIDRQ
jgi:hypothetical protein